MIERNNLIEWAMNFPITTRFQGDENGDITALVGEWPWTYYTYPDTIVDAAPVP